MTKTRSKHTGKPHHIEIHDEEETENTHAQVTRGNTRKNQKTGLSYCRPSRDYKKCVKWSGAMNKEIYLMYMRAKPTEKGYQKRLKVLWDENYPTLSNMTARHLAEQVRNIKKKNLISELDRKMIERNFETNIIQPEENTGIEAEHHAEVSQNEEMQDDTNLGDNSQKPDVTGVRENVIIEDKSDIDEIDPRVKEELKVRWRKHFQKYINIDVEEREYRTTINNQPRETLLRVMDIIVSEEIEEIEQQYNMNLWTLNVIYYTTAITLLEHEGKLREMKRRTQTRKKPGWQIRIESRIEAIRKKLSYTYVLIECHKMQHFTKHQRNIKYRMEKQYGKITTSKLKHIQMQLKQDLKIECQKLRDRKVIQQRRYINRLFKNAPKKVYRSMKGQGTVPIKEIPTKEEITHFWGALWENPIQHKDDTPLMKQLDKDYCNNVTQKEYNITDEVLDKVLKKMANDKPGRDLLAGVWIKRMKSIKEKYKEELKKLLNNEKEPPEWLLTSKTLLLPKNKITNQAQNYRPIAIQNTMYKVYTAILAEFIMEHCEENNIITEEQAAGKRGSWGCTDQLLINKMIYDEVTSNRRNLVTVWLDYKKAFDSVPHSWLIRSLEMAKVPEKIILAIRQLMIKWKTKVYLYGESSNVETDFISYLKGILQGDTLSLILFVLSVSPLSHLLQRHEGYKAGKIIRIKNISHLFFVDDLKLYAISIEKMKQMLETVTQFSNEVGMNFGEAKCAYQSIERGRRKPENESLYVNGLNIQEIKEGDNYKYLGIDESVRIDGPLNKDRIRKEYKSRVRKIWKSELNGYNKVIAHNAFAVALVIPTIGILKWTKKEISDLDVITRKILTMTGSFHKAGDTDRLYAHRSKGGRGLRSIEDLYEIRMVGLMEHLEQAAVEHSLLKLVEEHERETIRRLGKEFIERREVYQESSNVKEGTRKEREEKWKRKVTHGYLQKTLSEDETIDMKKTNKWLNLHLPAHTEGYITAIQEQELDTKETRKRREKHPEKKKSMDILCRVCKKAEESVYHLVCACPVLAPTLYLNIRHNQVACILYQEITGNEKMNMKPPPVTSKDQMEIWWDQQIRTITKIEKNKPDIIIWHSDRQLCQIIEITVPLDTNLKKAYKDKQEKYIPLITNMQRVHRRYKYETVIITMGAMGAVPQSLEENLKKLNFAQDRIKTVTERMQKAALIGTMKICKTVMGM